MEYTLHIIRATDNLSANSGDCVCNYLFRMQDIHPNVNPQIGRMMRKRKKPRRDFGNSGTGNTIMGGAAGLIGGVMLMDMLDGDGFF